MLQKKTREKGKKWTPSDAEWYCTNWGKYSVNKYLHKKKFIPKYLKHFKVKKFPYATQSGAKVQYNRYSSIEGLMEHKNKNLHELDNEFKEYGIDLMLKKNIYKVISKNNYIYCRN